MLHFYKFRQELFAPTPARDVYAKRPTGRGWPEECPPIRAANGFGFDVLANFDATFTFDGDAWHVEPDVELASDFDYAADDDGDGQPMVQRYAWFWERGQQLPHVISDDVWQEVRHQVKLSTFLFLQTDPNELLMMTSVPWPGGEQRLASWRTVPALIDTDWYPASYPWHVVLELDPNHSPITIDKGTPLARLLPIRRDTYFAREMTPRSFGDFIDRGQHWLSTHGKPTDDPAVRDLRKTYVRQQVRSKFVVME